MKVGICTILVAAFASVAGAAHAQDETNYLPPTPYSPSDPSRGVSGWSPDLSRGDPGAVSFEIAMHPGIAALEANDFVQAETLLAKSLRYNKNDVSLRLHMGIAKMELGKWDEARQYLRTPAREMRKDPEPKSLLGVTYVQLGDIAGAKAQRDALVQMAAACEGTCARAADIQSGIQLIDSALAQAGVSS
jgi:predicted Zn-dependent protease